jgi:PmbA protein
MRKMVVDSSVATRLIAPMITALDSASIQQKNSFLEDCIGKKVFSEGLTVMDLARTPGQTGSRMYDTEGVATQDRAIIENGVVKMNFTSTYMANKMGIEPTCEGVSRPVLMPYGEATGVKQIISKVKNGIYVTGFNGGNCNPVTGDFSYGVEGFAFKDGKITHPVREMLITGNMVELWNNLLYAGTDARSCTRWRVPSLAFQGVSFSA